MATGSQGSTTAKATGRAPRARTCGSGLGGLQGSLRACGEGMALGSRYSCGGRIEGEWSLRRFLTSRAATSLAHPLAACADPLSALYDFDPRSLPPARALRPEGYKIALKLMVRGRLRVPSNACLTSVRTCCHGNRIDYGWVRHGGQSTHPAVSVTAYMDPCSP